MGPGLYDRSIDCDIDKDISAEYCFKLLYITVWLWMIENNEHYYTVMHCIGKTPATVCI